jgi:hypothetical protein
LFHDAARNQRKHERPDDMIAEKASDLILAAAGRTLASAQAQGDGD